MQRLNQRKQDEEIVGLWNRLTRLFEDRLEVFFGGLLAEETDLVSGGRLEPGGEAGGDPLVGLRFSDPFARRPAHRAPFPS